MEITQWFKKDLFEFKECNTVGDLIKRIENKFWEKGEVLCEVKVNGMVLNESDEITFQNNDLDFVENILVKTSSPKKLIVESVGSINSILTEIEEKALNCSLEFRKGDLKQAQNYFDSCIGNAQLALDISSYVNAAYSQYSEDKQHPKSSWGSVQQDFMALSHQISDTFVKKDYVLIADLMEYEMTNLVLEWKSWVNSLKAL